MPADEAPQLAWAVKNLRVDRVRDILAKWPHGAALIDSEDNTLFHLAASEAEKYGGHPAEAEEMFQLLFQTGWTVVDMKNRCGERADAVAAKADPHGVAKRLLASRSHDFREKLRMEEPLPLVVEESPEPWRWQFAVADDQRRSWAAACFGAVPKEKCEEWMKTTVENAPWQQLPDTLRKAVWFVSADFADMPYRYSGLEYIAQVFPPWMEEIRAEVCALCGIPPDSYPNSCNVNIYEDQRGEVGWHSDDEVLFQGLAGDTRIISFSLGSPRDFCWRLQGTTETLGSIPLGDGDIATMEGLFQKHYKHAVPASEKPCGPRINFTFRWIVVKAHAADAETKAAAVV